MVVACARTQEIEHPSVAKSRNFFHSVFLGNNDQTNQTMKAAVEVPKPRFVAPNRERAREGNRRCQTMADKDEFL
jgi:hypothetical protein